MASPRADEKQLAFYAVEKIRKYGGVLEHPKKSTLWPAAGLPAPGGRDDFGGWTLPINQNWFGHKAEKGTYLYIVGCEPLDIPDLPLILGRAKYVVSTGSTNHIKKGHQGWRPSISHAEREKTPPELAVWLVELARRCVVVTA